MTIIGRRGRSHPSGVPPQITSVTPVDGRPDTPVTWPSRAYFNQNMLASSFNSSTMELRDNLGALVDGTVSYDSVGVRGVFDPTLDLETGILYTVKVKGGVNGVKNVGGIPMTSDYTWSYTTEGTPSPPPENPIVGWGSTTTGGGSVGDPGTTLYTPSTYAALKSAIQASGKRIIRPNSTVWIDGQGESINVTNPNMTIEGPVDWHGGIKRLCLRFRSGNHILTGLRLRMGDQMIDTGEADVITINPVSGGNWGASLSGIVIDHCSVLWSNDVVLAILNHVENVTVQHSIIGCGLYVGTNPSSPNGYGANITVISGNPQPDIDYGRKITFYKNFIVHNHRRNVKPERADLVDFVNNVIYNWELHACESNPRGANIIGNYFKKGPDTPASNRVWFHDTGIPEIANSIWWDQNLTRTITGASFTPTFTWGAMPRTSPYNGGPNNVTPETMTDALAAQIVAAAGPSYVDSIDQLLKNDFTNGTGAMWNGPSGAAPNPSWPAF